MEGTARRTLVMESDPAVAPEIAPWLWALADARRRTLETSEGLTPGIIDWQPPAGGNAIGTLLYHIALIEADWLLTEVLEEDPYLPDMAALFPLDARTADGRLTPCPGLTLPEHLARLDAVRARLLAAFRPMTADDFRRARHLPTYDVTPQWVLHHLLQHEAGHRGEIGMVRQLAVGS